MIMLTGCPSPGGNNINPGNPGSPERTLNFTLELSEPNGKPLELGIGPSLTTVTSTAGTAAVGRVRGKIYPITVTQVPPYRRSLTLTVRKKGFRDTVINITIPPKGNPPPQAKRIPYAYTTTITGKVVTPARAVYPTKGAVIKTAQVWASTDPENKVTVDTTDGSYTLKVADHTGSFTITADYTGTDGNYKAGAPQRVRIRGWFHSQINVALKYGYITTLSGRVFDNPPGASTTIPRNGATVIITTENRGLEVARTTSSTLEGNMGSYRVTFDHPGSFRVTTSFGGRSNSFEAVRITTPNYNLSPVLN